MKELSYIIQEIKPGHVYAITIQEKITEELISNIKNIIHEQIKFMEPKPRILLLDNGIIIENIGNKEDSK